jgi:glycosyltransferase involved in cell wall biosynthesis
VLLGGPVGAATGEPFVIKAHGSELEFAMRGNAELCRWACESLSRARLVLAGSEHVVGVLHDLLGDGDYTHPIRVLPPGVDIESFGPQARSTALPALIYECRRDAPNPRHNHDERRPDEGNADRSAEFLAGQAPTVVYVGKLTAEKGVSLLLEAAETLSDRAVRTVVVGFGPQRQELEQRAHGRVLFIGPLEHRHLAHLWPLADVSVTPSVSPEAFGMVAAEAAACGSPPLVARHSGLAEIATALEREYPASHRALVAFIPGDLDDLTAKLRALLTLPHPLWSQLSRAARRTAASRWSWEAISAELLTLADTSPRR